MPRAAAATLLLLVAALLIRRHLYEPLPAHADPPVADADAASSRSALLAEARCPAAPRPQPQALTPRGAPTGSRPLLLVYEERAGASWLLSMLRSSSSAVAISGAADAWLRANAARHQLGRPPLLGLALPASALAAHPNLTASLLGVPHLTVVVLSRCNRLKRALSVLRHRGLLSCPPDLAVHYASAAAAGRSSTAFTGPAGCAAPVAALLRFLATEDSASLLNLSCSFGLMRELGAPRSHAGVSTRHVSWSLGAALSLGLSDGGSAAAEGRVTAGWDASRGGRGSRGLWVDYEDLLYNTSGTMRRVWAALASEAGGGGGAGTAGDGGPGSTPPSDAAPASHTSPVKRSPNDLCLSISNFGAVCRALRWSEWRSDLGRLQPSWRDLLFRQCECPARRLGLVFAGSHHKTGTVLLQRLMKVYGGVARLPFERAGWQRCAAAQRLEAGICFEEHVTLGSLASAWLEPPSPPAAANAAAPGPSPASPAPLLRPRGDYAAVGGARLVHAVREPLEVCVSSYLYHLHSDEPWLRQNVSWYNGTSLQRLLRSLDTRRGLFLECRRSMLDQVAEQAAAVRATAADARVLTLRMEETEADYDGAMRRLFSFLLGAPGRGGRGDKRGKGGRAPRQVGETGSADADALLVEALVSAAAAYDTARNRPALDDGHLSEMSRKRPLRLLLLNDSAIARELATWRRAAGYDFDYAAHCRRYGLGHHRDAVEDGLRELSGGGVDVV